jgi:hypothetical protein
MSKQDQLPLHVRLKQYVTAYEAGDLDTMAVLLQDPQLANTAWMWHMEHEEIEPISTEEHAQFLERLKVADHLLQLLDQYLAAYATDDSDTMYTLLKEPKMALFIWSWFENHPEDQNPHLKDAIICYPYPLYPAGIPVCTDCQIALTPETTFLFDGLAYCPDHLPHYDKHQQW